LSFKLDYNQNLIILSLVHCKFIVDDIILNSKLIQSKF